MINIRQPSSGKPLGFFDSPQPADNDVPLYDTTTRTWSVGAVPNLYGAYDFIISSRQDLVDVVAPVGDVFVLPNGSYAETAAFALQANERIEVPAGGEVLWAQFGADELLDISPGAANFAWLVNGQLVLMNSAFRVNGDNAQGVRVTATGQLFAMGGEWTAASATGTRALQLEGGTNYLVDLDINTNWATGISVQGGQTVMQGGRVDSSGDCLVDGAVRGLKAIGAQFVSLNGSALMTDVATAEWRMSECRFALNAGTDPVLEVLDNELVSLVGCDVVGNGNDAGLAIDGNVPLIEVVNCRIDNVTNGIEYVAGTVNRAKVIGSDFNAFTGTAIEWPTASIPGSGLLVAACSGGAGTFLGGHSQFDARVNYKGNAANGALIQETPIVGPPTSISVTETGTQQDWVPDGDAEAFDRCTTLFVQTGGGGNLVIGGLAPPLRSTSRHRMQIVKVSAADDVILNDDDAGSAAAARIKVCVFRAIKLIDTSFVIEYATSAWRVVAAIGQELP